MDPAVTAHDSLRLWHSEVNRGMRQPRFGGRPGTGPANQARFATEGTAWAALFEQWNPRMHPGPHSVPASPAI